jgi:hypothetical protein
VRSYSATLGLGKNTAVQRYGLVGERLRAFSASTTLRSELRIHAFMQEKRQVRSLLDFLSVGLKEVAQNYRVANFSKGRLAQVPQ